MRGVALLLPVLCGVAGAVAVSKLLPPPTTLGATVQWWPLFAAGTVGPVILCSRVAKRLLPLAYLLNLAMLFPDETPNRLSVARKAGRTRDLKKSLDELNDLGDRGESTQAAAAVLALIAHLGSHDRRTRGHSERVRVVTDMLAEELDLKPDERNALRWGALLHDIGKLTVSAETLNKTGRPNHAEWIALRRHPVEGTRIAEPLWKWLGVWMGAIEHHHERFDGSGYPYGLAGDQISLGGRIVAVADSYETMTAARSYKKPMSVNDARAELVKSSGSHFDPAVVRQFLSISTKRLWVAAGLAAFLAQLPVLGGLWTRGVTARVGRSVAALGATAAIVAGLGAGGFLDTSSVSPRTPPARAAAASPVAQVPHAAVAMSAPAPHRRRQRGGAPGPKAPTAPPPGRPPTRPIQEPGTASAASSGPAAPHHGAPPPPFVARGHIDGADPEYQAIGGVTQTDFETECGIPVTQGLDGWVFPIPIDYRETVTTAEVTGDNPVAHNLEVFFYSATCAPLGAITGANTDEAGPLPSGTAFAVVDEAAMPGTSVVLRLQPTGQQ